MTAGRSQGRRRALAAATACGGLAVLSFAAGMRPAASQIDRLQPLVVWMDVDPSVAPGGHEIDDGLALLQAFHSPELTIRGVTAVFGNAALDTTFPIAREMVLRFGPAGLQVWPGAARADRLGEETAASRALAQALRAERLTILALGPVTNVATVLRNHPELSDRIAEIVAVAGRRAGQRFVAGTANGRPLRDLNFELDPAAFQALLDSPVPIALAPFEISSHVTLTAADVERFAAGTDATRWLAQPAADLLKWWADRFGADGMHPFDTLGVAYLTSPRWLRCETLPVAIEQHPDDVAQHGAAGAAVRSKPYLIVNPASGTGRSVRYCFDVDPAFKADLMDRLLAS